MRGTHNLPVEILSGLTETQELTVSVVICTRFRMTALRDCLSAIAKLKRLPDELIIVDNSAGDKDTEKLAQEFSAIYLVESNVGLSHARNRGLSASKSTIVAYLDDDALPDEDWLEHLIEPFSDPRVAVVTGETILSDAEKCTTANMPPSILDKSDQLWFEISAFGGLGIGTNMALRRSACKVPDFFDERLGRGAPFHGMEEHHAFVQLLSQNHCAVHIPAAIVYHSSKNPMDIKREARILFAYSMLLFVGFPHRRMDLLRFLFRRMRHKPLTWKRNSPDPGAIISSSWQLLLKASVSGALLYLRTKRRKK